MNIDFKKILYVMALVIIQCLLDNFVDLSVYIRIVILPYIILILPYRYNTIPTMLLAFIIGLAVDVLTTGVLGLNAGALTSVAFIRQKLLHMILDERNMKRHDSPDYKVMGLGKSLFYIAFPSIVYFTIYILLDNYGFHPYHITIPKIIIGAVICTAIGLILFKNQKKD
jgi:rod shape-determining protein MreD